MCPDIHWAQLEEITFGHSFRITALWVTTSCFQPVTNKVCGMHSSTCVGLSLHTSNYLLEVTGSDF